MSTLSHLPAVYDVLNDVHRICLSDEKVGLRRPWHHAPAEPGAPGVGGTNVSLGVPAASGTAMASECRA